uniref:KH type-2 domain-containing protein n=1 Tax=Bursaphelenchus xylophilus TaxID=6326 RepID=A0A1I7RSU9_BURXY
MVDDNYKFWYDMLKTTMIIRQLRLEGWSKQFSRLINGDQIRELEMMTTTKIIVEEDCIQIFGTPRGTRKARDLLRSIILSLILDNEPEVSEYPQVLEEQTFAVTEVVKAR